jgi:hypothetical protein
VRAAQRRAAKLPVGVKISEYITAWQDVVGEDHTPEKSNYQERKCQERK